MTLTDDQRRQLGLYAEWRDIVISLNNLESYLRFTKLESLDFAGVRVAVDELERRRDGFLVRWEADMAQTREVAHAVAHGAGAVSVADGGLSDGQSDDAAVWSEGEGQSIAGD